MPPLISFIHSWDRMQVSKRMSFEQFLHALKECATAKGDDVCWFTQAIASCRPIVYGTVAGHIKLCVVLALNYSG